MAERVRGLEAELKVTQSALAAALGMLAKNPACLEEMQVWLAMNIRTMTLLDEQKLKSMI